MVLWDCFRLQNLVLGLLREVCGEGGVSHASVNGWPDDAIAVAFEAAAAAYEATWPEPANAKSVAEPTVVPSGAPDAAPSRPVEAVEPRSRLDGLDTTCLQI